MRTIGVGAKIAISLLALISFSILLSNYSVYAEESSVSTATVTINQSCSMVGTTNTAHTANLANGTYSDSNYPNGIGQTTLKVFCNDSAGFAIYAIGYTNNEYGNTKLHNDTLGSTYDISTGIYTSGTTINSTWSMKLASVSGIYAPTISDGTNNTENFTTWHVIPTEYTKVAYRTSTTDADNNGQGTGSSLTTTYDAYVSATQPAGTYIGQVKYTLVHPNKVDNSNKPVAPMTPTDCPAGYVCYAPNASDIVGSMSSLGSITSSPTAGKISVGTSATTINLIAPNYKREGYGFAGWSTDFTATNASTIYGPNETLTVPSTTLATKGMILYPVWVASAGNLQGWSGCSSLTTAPNDGTRATLASMTALTDTRDGNFYTVARLADGKCWMTENLRLNGTVNATTIASDSQGVGGAFTALPQSVDLNWSSNTHNNLYAGLSVATLPQLNTNNTNARMMGGTGTNASSATLINTPGDPISTFDQGQEGTTFSWYSYGNYYSWSSAIADTTAYIGNNDHVDTTSICPAGWHLPEGGNKDNSANSEFWALSVAIIGAEPANTSSETNPYYKGSPEGYNASMSLRTFPNNFIYSGYWGSDSAGGRGSNGRYWSSSAINNQNAYYLYFMSSTVQPGTKGSYKFYGASVRCVAGS